MNSHEFFDKISNIRLKITRHDNKQDNVTEDQGGKKKKELDGLDAQMIQMLW